MERRRIEFRERTLFAPVVKEYFSGDKNLEVYLVWVYAHMFLAHRCNIFFRYPILGGEGCILKNGRFYRHLVSTCSDRFFENYRLLHGQKKNTTLQSSWIFFFNFYLLTKKYFGVLKHVTELH